MAGVVQLVAIGSVARSLLKEIAEPLAVQFGVEAALSGGSLLEPKYAFNKDRNQYHSSAILRRLATLRAKEQVGVVGVLELDVFVPDLDFVFGEADRECKAGLVSLARLRPEFYGEPYDNELLRARGRAQLVHEVGHLLGLAHCEDVRCAMLSPVTVADLDRKGTAICTNCRAELARQERRR